jgi:hypothetical protein
MTTHLCGHLPLRETAETADTFCPKCVAWDCTDTACAGHQRWPEVNETGGQA